MEDTNVVIQNTELDRKQEWEEERIEQEKRKGELKQEQKELNVLIGKNIRKLRGCHSQQYVADVLEIDRTFLGRLEHGEFKNISTLLLKKIADQFNVSIDMLFNSGA